MNTTHLTIASIAGLAAGFIAVRAIMRHRSASKLRRSLDVLEAAYNRRQRNLTTITVDRRPIPGPPHVIDCPPRRDVSDLRTLTQAPTVKLTSSDFRP